MASTLTTAPEDVFPVKHKRSRLITHRERHASQPTHKASRAMLTSAHSIIPHSQTLLSQVASCWIRKHCFQTYAQIMMPTETMSLGDTRSWQKRTPKPNNNTLIVPGSSRVTGS